MDVKGYLVEATWDGVTLRARGTNKAGHVALLGVDKDQPEAVIPVTDMASVELKDASRLVNGNLIIKTTGGKKYQLHYRRKSADDFHALHAAILAAQN